MKGTGWGGTIVCGVSTSEGSRAAAQLAAALAARLGLRLVLVHVVVERATLPGDATERRLREKQALEAIARELGGVEARVVVGGRVDAIARVAAEEGADAIVVGSRPRGARGRQLRCSLAPTSRPPSRCRW